MTPLHRLGESLRYILMEIPLPLVRWLFVATLVAVLVWVIRLPRSVTTPPDGAKRWDENLKYAACFALVLQILIYWML